MLIDLLDSASYIMVNKNAIKTIGLTAAVYCAELINIYKKAVTKNKLFDNKYFKVDREYVQRQTSISIDNQIACDQNLLDLEILERDESNPDMLFFNVEIYASMLASQDIKLLDTVAEKIKANPKLVKAAKKDRQVTMIKESLESKSTEILCKLYSWVDSIIGSGKYVSKPQAAAFTKRLDEYCGNDTAKALQIIDLAIVHAYVDCQWAINLYERGNKPPVTAKPQVRVTPEKKTVELDKEILF